MLVLTRKREEKITIGKNPEIVITILKIQGDKVSIGVEADRNTPVYRTELLTRERSEKKKESTDYLSDIPIENMQIDLEKEQQQLTTAVYDNNK